ncbi:MAG: lipopolysaccharide biosynthesis protein [Bacteroidota bacterium]
MEGPSLRGRALSGILWMSADRLLLFAVAAIVTAVLARLLPPSDFGVVGAALVAVEIGVQVVNASVTPALVQRSEIPRGLLATAFWLACGLSVVLYGAVFLATPLLATFFGMPALLTVLPVLALLFVFDGVSSVARARQQRALAFREVVIIRAVADVVGLGVVSIGLALAGYGVWALVGGRLAQSVLRAVGFLARFPHPVTAVGRGYLGELVRFGGGVSLQGLLNSLARQGDAIVVGRMLGASALGLYNRSYKMMALPAGFLAESFNGVLFPVMSQVKDRPESLSTALYRTTALLALLLLPFSVTASALAPEIVLVVLGPDWRGAIGALQVLALGMFFRAGYKTGMTILKARGRVYLAAGLQGTYAVLVVLGAVVGARYGLVGISTGAVIAVVCFFLLGTGAAIRETGGSVRPLLRALMPGLLVAAVGGGLALLAAAPLREVRLSPVATLLAGGGASGAVWLTALAFAPSLLGQHGRWLHQMVLQALGRGADFTPAAPSGAPPGPGA